MQRFTNEPLIDIVRYLETQLESQEQVLFSVPKPDLNASLFSGETTAQGMRHRPWRVWFDLAEKLECHFSIAELTPTFITLRLDKLNRDIVPMSSTKSTEKYGTSSGYSRIDKLEESSFLLNYLEALERIDLKQGARVLSLGVNTGNELKAFDYLKSGVGASLEFVGVDHSATAIAQAKRDFGARGEFVRADVNALAGLELGTFDLVMALGTLQSPGIDDRAALRYMVQALLKQSGSLLIAFPNSTYLDGQLIYGARMKNFRQAELSLVIKDTAYYRKYLQQHHFKVFITGKYYWFITAVPA